MLSRSKSLQQNFVRLIQSRGNEYVVLEQPFKRYIKIYLFSTTAFNATDFLKHQENNICKWEEDAKIQKVRFCSSYYFLQQQEKIIRMKNEIGNVKLKEKRDILLSFFPRDTWTMDNLVCYNFPQSLLESVSTHSKEADNFVIFVIDVMRNVAYKLWGFHDSEKIYGNLNPENVLVSRPVWMGDKSMRTTLVDGGIESLNWKAPEHLLENIQTSSSDMFSFGCLLYFCFTGGGSPFGNAFDEVENNIRKNKINLSKIKHMPEAFHIISLLLSPNPDMRPSAQEVLHHPLFWDSYEKLYFIDSVLSYVTYEELKDPMTDLTRKVIADLKLKIPILADEKWRKMYREILGALRRRAANHPASNMQFNLGTSFYSGFFVELGIEVFKVLKSAGCVESIGRVALDDYHRFPIQEVSYF